MLQQKDSFLIKTFISIDSLLYSVSLRILYSIEKWFYD
jgi:hypothetical protein